MTFAHGPSNIRIGDLEVPRLGFGAMRIPGKDIWGEPEDPARAKAVLKRVLDLGIKLIDTSWYYGPLVANEYIAKVLHPYPKDLVIATKLGGKRLPDKGWAPFARPEDLREGCETDLKTLKLERLDIVHFRFIGMPGGVPFLESLDAMIELKKEGKIRHLGLSNIGPKQVEQAIARTPIVTVQNMYTASANATQLAKMTHSEVEDPEGVLALCEKHSIAYLPFFPLAVGGIDKKQTVLDRIAKSHDASPSQIAIAWLLARSQVMLPIPGTSRVEHLEENWAARSIKLADDEIEAITEARA